MNLLGTTCATPPASPWEIAALPTVSMSDADVAVFVAAAAVLNDGPVYPSDLRFWLGDVRYDIGPLYLLPTIYERAKHMSVDEIRHATGGLYDRVALIEPVNYGWVKVDGRNL